MKWRKEGKEVMTVSDIMRHMISYQTNRDAGLDKCASCDGGES